MFPPGGHPESIRWSLCERIEGEDSAAVRRDATAEDRRVFGLPRPRPPGAFHNKNLFIAGSEPHSVRRLSRCAKGAAPHQRIVAGVPLDHYSATVQEIRSRGYVAYGACEFRPYLKGAASLVAAGLIAINAQEIRSRGYVAYGACEFRPYLKGAASLVAAGLIAINAQEIRSRGYVAYGACEF